MLVRITALGPSHTYAHCRPDTPHDAVRAIYLPVEQCEGFDLTTARIGDLLDLVRVEDSEAGPRAVGARFIERPARDPITGTVRTVNASRGFGFLRPDDGTSDIFIHVRSFADFDGQFSDTLLRLAPGDRLRCVRLPGGRGPRGVEIEAA